MRSFALAFERGSEAPVGTAAARAVALGLASIARRVEGKIATRCAGDARVLRAACNARPLAWIAATIRARVALLMLEPGTYTAAEPLRLVGEKCDFLFWVA